MIRLLSLVLPGAFVLGSTVAHAITPSPQPDREISPLLVATNLWYGDPAPEVWRQVREARVRLIRIGGHAYDKNPPEPSTLVEWVKKIRAHGAEPVIQVSQYQPPEKAAELVRLFNRRRAAGAPVLIWNIGNEPWLQNGRRAPESVAAEVVAYWKPIAAAMKAVDPAIRLYGFDEAYYIEPAYEALFGGEHDITGRVPGKTYHYCDGLSWHRYPQTNNEPGLAEIEDFHASMQKIRALLDRANALHRRRGDDALQWGLGEFNAKGGRQVHTFGNGQLFAAVYGLAAHYGANYAASWSIFESNGNRGHTDFGAFDGKDYVPRSSYWHQRLFGEYFKGVTVRARSSREDVLVFASHDKRAERLSVMILNLSDRPEHLGYELQFGTQVASKADVVIGLELPGRAVHTGTIAARSSQFLSVDRRELVTTVYTAADFEAARPPTAKREPAPFAVP